ncbi:DUF1996 domain-containing protein [Streptomyces sp. NBC_01216]|uniref:DUF1996 domain-containing protein n=1 Tax=Streptomyces sp. NBC_01216 TaxID=2903778 RepID=UPI002E0F5E46|nr:DUF1996 domain-containing protein [Streptomyces sp. NBC_01216]
MGRTSRRRSTLANRAIAASAALLLGGGGLVAANFDASAHESWGGDRKSPRTQSAGQSVSTIDCPEVVNSIKEIPDDQRRAVDRELATLDNQITTYYKRFAENKRRVQSDRAWAQNQILTPLKNERLVIIQRIVALIDRSAERPKGLKATAPCTLRRDDNDGNKNRRDRRDRNNNDQNGNDGNNDGQDQGDGQVPVDNGNGAAGPVAEDFIDINGVRPNSRDLENGLVANGRTGSTGSFTTKCGVNENDLSNSDNLIVAPGVDNGAHHTHDYVGNQDNDAFSSNEDLAKAGTSCQNQADKSTYYWPVLRLQDGTKEFDANDLGGGAEGNVGKILKASEAELKFVGNKQSRVVAMPKFLRIITGDAKAFTNGLANANTSFSCTGFEDRQVTDKYVLCPEGSQVVRTSNFQSCWDGRNIDSANHRDHVAFVEADGSCPKGFRAIPQLQARLVYDVPTPTIENGQVQNPYAVDGFPEQLHKPITDHNDFINVFDENLMNKMVNCINRGKNCQ